MNNSFVLSPKKRTKIDPDRILVCREDGLIVATVYVDGNVSFVKQMLNILEIDQISAIVKNFYLFFNNLG